MNEDLVREVLRADADAVRTDVDLLGGVAALRRGRRRRGAMAGGVVLAVVLVASAVAVPVSLRHHSAVQPKVEGPALATSVSAPATSAPAPAGTRAVTFGGITLDVPASWGTNQLSCGTPAANTVWYDFGAVPACARVYASGSPGSVEDPFSSLEVSTSDLTGRSTGFIPSPTVGFAGLPAHEFEENAGDGPATLVNVYIPSRHVSFAVTAPDRQTAERILATAHQATRYDGGCATAEPSDLPVVLGGSAAGRQYFGNPPNVDVCDYEYGWLLAGSQVTGRAQAALAAALEATPPGYTAMERAAGRQVPEQTRCTDVDTVVVQFAESVIEARVSIRLQACDGHGPGIASSSGQQTALTADVLTALYPLLPTHVGSSYITAALAQPTTR